MWMDVGIYSVKDNSQAGNTWVYVMTTRKGVSKNYWYNQHI